MVKNIGISSCALFLLAAVSLASPAINVALEASFNAPPYLLELLETAAEENSTAYFPLLDAIADGRFADCTTDKELYDTFLHTVQNDGHIATPESLSSLQFALSIHSAVPRIEAHYQYYRTSIEPSLMLAQDAACPTWVHFNGKQYCSTTLDRAQQDVGLSKSPEILPFDRILRQGADVTTPPAVLYADITSPLFGEFHQEMSSRARNAETTYRIRYRLGSPPIKSPLVVNGYGVELALKRTDYIVIDDRTDRSETVATETPLSEPQETLLEAEELADLKPLSSSELLGLGPKAASFVMASEDPLKTLLQVSQDFPKHSSAITKRNISDDFFSEHRQNRDIFLPAGYNVIWMNGLQVETRQMDAFALLEKLRRERGLIHSLQKAGFSGSEAVKVISHSSIAESKIQSESQRYDYRDSTDGGRVIIWLNDIEKDKRYQSWPRYLNALLQRTFPGQLPTVRRNIHHVVIPIDPTDAKDLELLVESLQAFVKRKVPIRFGIVPCGPSLGAQEQSKVIYYLLDTYGLSSVFTYLEMSLQGKKLSSVQKASFEAAVKDRMVRREQSELSLQTVLVDNDLEARFEASQKYLKRLGAYSKTPPLFVNGVAIPRNEGWLQAMSAIIDQDLRAIQQQVFEESISEDAWLAGQFLEHAATQRNALIVPEDENAITIVDIGNLFYTHEESFSKLPRIPAKDNPSTQLPTMLLVVADLDSDEGMQLAEDAAQFIQDRTEVEILLLHNPGPASSFQNSVVLSKWVEKHGAKVNVDSLSTILTLKKTMIEQGKIPDLGYPPEEIEESKFFWSSTRAIVDTLRLEPGERALLLNGRLVGPIPQSVPFRKDEFLQLYEFEASKRTKPVQTALESLGFEARADSPLSSAIITSVVALSTISDVPEGIFESASHLRMSNFDNWYANYTMISTGDVDNASIHLVASIDLTSEIAQRWIPMLKVLSELTGVYLRLFLNPREQMQELPIKRFYRHVLDSKPSFKSDGSVQNLQATFERVPKEALLNLALDVPPAWLVAPKESLYDLDNIKLSSLKEGVSIDATYELEHILIEGHSRDVNTGQPPRGVQLLLGTHQNAHFADTIIMANLGYFQFKANPGYWNIQLQDGRSSQIFNIDSAGQNGYSPQPGDESTEITLMSFQGKTLYPRLSHRPGREEDDVLEEPGKMVGKAMDYLSKATKFASSVLSNVGFAPLSSTQADINIFSVASGHLYERMLNIMMVSVMRHTNHTVKFWFIEQFLSPSFKASLPHLAAHYHFSYELVTYKWPHWLRAQKEKQREIWGYKILFLDVLFPLSLDKVIFVDADQIVRTDMHDLVQHDLEGAPYAFTPMCDSRTEMEGFRFWKQGYWASFLRGAPYHISALYVVDLHAFRTMAAGDRLRQQYHSLSADPNSLSNLDQDLPNHMQHVLPIHSLPQEWLWCETWCDDESLKTARTIDLCNNPMTKEPKLDRARRQVPEWVVYDAEIAGVLKAAQEQGARVGVEGEVVKEIHTEGEEEKSKPSEADGEQEQEQQQGQSRTRDEL
ncbi:MAG: hypothetical protein LQ342_005190 [Letrouitia transgressa]|nr:MAG: hypothetical protein LQ342_005190 [Letrouitia transgressa]